MDPSLALENRAVLDFVQAALGLISREIKVISLRAEPGRIFLYIAVRERTAEVEEDVDDLMFEIRVLQDRMIDVEAEIHVGAIDAAWTGFPARRVYVAKEA